MSKSNAKLRSSWFDRPGEVVDATGRRFKLFDPSICWLLDRHEQIERHTLDRIMNELSGEARVGRRFLLGGIMFVLLITVAAATLVAIDIALEGRAAAQDLISSLIFTAPAVIMMMIAAVVLPVIVARKRRLTASRDVILRHGHCPHCAYRIREITPMANGHTICAECGAAWVMPRFVPTAQTNKVHRRRHWFLEEGKHVHLGMHMLSD